MTDEFGKLSLPHIASLVYNTPLMITDAKLATIMSFLTPRLYGGGLLTAADLRHQGVEHRELTPVAAGASLAVIPVDGVLLNRAVGMDAFSGLQSYESISASFDEALGEFRAGKISAIVMQLGTPGGTGHGVFDLTDKIFQMRNEVPIFAVVDSEANSAGYLLASAATKIYATRTSALGSIGARVQHVDTSELEAKMGVKHTDIFAGARKVKFSPHKPLTAEDKAEAQELVNGARMDFAEMVSRNRNLPLTNVLGQEAAIFLGEAAVTAGLADVVMSVEQAFEDIVANLQTDRSNTNMSVQNNQNASVNANANNAGIAADLNAPAQTVTPLPIPGLESVAPAVLMPAVDSIPVTEATANTQAAVLAERERITGIFALEEAEGKFAMALEASKQGLDLEAAKSLLAAAPKAAESAKGSPLDAAMSGVNNPEIGAEGAVDSDEEKDLVARIVASGTAIGVKFAASAS